MDTKLRKLWYEEYRKIADLIDEGTGFEKRAIDVVSLIEALKRYKKLAK